MTTHEELQEAQRAQQARIRELIGAEKMDEYAAYQRSLPARSELDRLEQQLAAESVPLQEDQRRQRIAAMVEDRQQHPQPAFDRDSMAPEDRRAQFLAWQAERDERAVEAGRTVLSGRQQQLYEELMQYEAAMRERFARAARTQGEAVPIAPGTPAGATARP